MIQATYWFDVDVPSEATVGDYRECVERMRERAYPETKGDLSTIRVNLVIEGEDCFKLGLALADEALELDSLLTPYGWRLPDRDTWEHVETTGAPA
jgi:hypothetical protein